MLIPKNYANQMRSKILVKVVESFYKDKFETADNIPIEMRPKDYDSSRCCIYKDRAVLKYRLMAALGVTPEEETDEAKRLSDYGKEALKRQNHAKSCLSVIDIACSACVKSQYMVTDACRGCFARPCMMNCPKQAISFVNGRSHINPDICVSCGKCMEVCPYHAIVKLPVPCEEACPVGAIRKDEHGVEHINEEACISCGKCLQSCPFGAIVERSQLVDVLNLIHNSDKKVIAMVAPAIAGQFPFDMKQVIGALKKAGFADVVEVAAGADITSTNEAAEFIERMEEGAKFMTTSCCPAYYRAASIHIPEIKPFVSNTKTPMYYTAEMLKKEQPDCVSVFVGPCLAKRTEAEYDPNVDYVLTFEAIGEMFVGAGIEIADCEPADFAKVSSAQGRNYPLSGGVAAAVGNLVEGKVDFRPERIDGLSKENLKLLKRYATKGCENNMIEVMCCEGGCIAGPGCISLARKAAKQVETYVAEGQNQKEMK